MKSTLASVAALALLVSACSDSDGPAAGGPDIPDLRTGIGGGSVELTHTADDTPAELTGIVDAAGDELAGRLDVARSSVDVAAVQEVVWADSSYGCPAPDVAYVPGGADGLRIVLVVDGEFYEYRLAGDLVPDYCDPAEGLVTNGVADGAIATDDADKGSIDDTSPGSEDAESDEIEIEITPTDPKETEPTEGLNPPDE